MAVTWIILSALFKPHRAGVLHHRGQPVFIRVFEVLKYWAWLLLEILKSNISVTRILLDPSLPIKPVLRTVSATPDTELGRVVYANSITLTPGTTAINFTKNGDILVHALHEDSLIELEQDVMAAHVRRIERAQDWVTDEDATGSGPIADKDGI